MTDLADEALHYAKTVGADRVINMAKEPDGLEAYQQGKGTFDVLFECSGAMPALRSAIAAMRPRGVIVQLGLGGDMELPMMQITAKELTSAAPSVSMKSLQKRFKKCRAARLM